MDEEVMAEVVMVEAMEEVVLVEVLDEVVMEEVDMEEEEVMVSEDKNLSVNRFQSYKGLQNSSKQIKIILSNK
jgi:hypothetical protein